MASTISAAKSSPETSFGQERKRVKEKDRERDRKKKTEKDREGQRKTEKDRERRRKTEKVLKALGKVLWQLSVSHWKGNGVFATLVLFSYKYQSKKLWEIDFCRVSGRLRQYQTFNVRSAADESGRTVGSRRCVSSDLIAYWFHRVIRKTAARLKIVGPGQINQLVIMRIMIAR